MITDQKSDPRFFRLINKMQESLYINSFTKFCESRCFFLKLSFTKLECSLHPLLIISTLLSNYPFMLFFACLCLFHIQHADCVDEPVGTFCIYDVCMTVNLQEHTCMCEQSVSVTNKQRLCGWWTHTGVQPVCMCARYSVCCLCVCGRGSHRAIMRLEQSQADTDVGDGYS